MHSINECHLTPNVITSIRKQSLKKLHNGTSYLFLVVVFFWGLEFQFVFYRIFRGSKKKKIKHFRRRHNGNILRVFIHSTN